MIVYLSGGMEHANNDGSGWRLKFARWLQNNLEHEVINPVQESRKLVQEKNATNYRAWRTSDPQRYKKFIRCCIDHDLRLVIGHADYMVCLWDESVLKGGGTHGEVTMAYFVGKPVYLVNELSNEDLSGWISSCAAETFSSFDLLKTALLKQYKS